ncbi:hypothetical protein CDL15_Pgr011287 [Punica granatum]|uniref:Uncharacterized protein n=1 Tax=Punica granatum TaxID=22663 RepID=A0A218WFN1_PUNGR|nr:hypothetical protein CDL15_Pgr011287 [Punica granatum]PKI40686.1 hypothetical protein CRG98_038941 [Punica granatum]
MGNAVRDRRTPLLCPTSSSPLTLLLTGSAHLLVCAGLAQQIRPSPLCPVHPRRSDPFRLASPRVWPGTRDPFRPQIQPSSSARPSSPVLPAQRPLTADPHCSDRPVRFERLVF